MSGTAGLNPLQPGDHVCVPFTGRETYIDLVTGFVVAALDAREKVLCYTSQFMPVAIQAAVESVDRRASEAVATGQITIAAATDSYLTTGRFEPGQMIDGWRRQIDEARHGGYQGLRVIADMAWAAGPVPGADRLASYEAEVNRVFAAGFATVACLYDRKRFSRRQLHDFTSAHPGTLDLYGGTGPQLRLSHTENPAGLMLAGEADLSNYSAVAAVLAGLADDIGHRPVTIDLSQLRFADVACATAIVRTGRTVPVLKVTGASPDVAYLLDVLADFENVPVKIEASA